MKINEVEAAVGVTKKNIRFYEEEGLITPSREPGNGYRSYSQADACAASSCCASWMCRWPRSGKCWKGRRRWPREWPSSWNV